MNKTQIINKHKYRRYAKKLKKEKQREERTHVGNLEELYFKPCIYFLKYNNNIVYIGETTSLMNRISQHINECVKVFDTFSYEVFDGTTKERKHKESVLIRRLKPHYNIVHNPIKNTSL